jgi:hypothetical protein
MWGEIAGNRQRLDKRNGSYVDLQVDGQPLEIVALDGIPEDKGMMAKILFE